MILCAFFSFLISLVLSSYFFQLGEFGGDSGFYIENARKITNIQYYIEHIKTPYYWGYPTYLALCFNIIGERYAAIAIIQIAIKAGTIMLLYSVISDVQHNFLISFLVPLFYSVIVDVMMWDCRILSDSLGVSLEMCTIYCFWKLRKDYRWRRLLLFVLSAFAFFTTRTNSSALLIVFFIYILRDLPNTKKHYAYISIAVLVVIFLILYNASYNTIHGLPSRVSYYINLLKSGSVVVGRPQYDYSIPSDHYGTPWIVIDYTIVLLKRMVMFWSVFFSEHSLRHKIYCIVTVLPVFVLSIPAMISTFKKRKTELYPFAFGVLSYHVVSIFTELEYDMRYRMPIFLLLVIVNSDWLVETRIMKKAPKGLIL